MANRIPVELDVEYRGVAPESEFVAKDTGQLVHIAPKLKLEVETVDGDVEMLVVSSGQLDKAEGGFDYTTLNRGDRFKLIGLVVLHDRGSGRDSYFQVQRVEV